MALASPESIYRVGVYTGFTAAQAKVATIARVSSQRMT